MSDSKKHEPFEIKVVQGWNKEGVRDDYTLDYTFLETFIALPAFAHPLSARWDSSKPGFNDEFQFVEFVTYFNNIPNMVRIPYAVVMSWAEDIKASSEGNPNWADKDDDGDDDKAADAAERQE